MHATTEPEIDRDVASPPTEPFGSSYDETGEFRAQTVLAMFLTGGVLGAGAALLLAPHSGKKTRRRISRRVRRVTGRERSTWDRVRRITGREKSTWDRLRRTLAQAAAERRNRNRREDQRAEDMRASSERARAL